MVTSGAIHLWKPKRCVGQSDCLSGQPIPNGGLQTHPASPIIKPLMMEPAMATVVTINRPDVVSLIERAADKLTRGNKTEAVALAMQRLLDSEERSGSLFGFMGRGSMQVQEGWDLTQPAIDEADWEGDPFLKHEP